MTCCCSLAGTVACQHCRANSDIGIGVTIPNINTGDYWRPTPVQPPKPTNADRIRSMTDEELAEFLDDEYPRNKKEWLDWLKQEVT